MQKIKFNLLISQSQHLSGFSVLTPVLMPGMLRTEISPAAMAQLLADALDRDLMKQGDYDVLLRYFTAHEPEQERIEVQIAASPDHLFPALAFTFDLFCIAISEWQWLGFVPGLDLQVGGSSKADLIENARENIRLELVRNKRLLSVPRLIETQWFSQSSIHSIPIQVPVYSLAELEQISRAEEDDILPRIARPVIHTENEVFGLEKEAEQILTAMSGDHKGSVLVVGGEGTGKTVLIREVARTLMLNSERLFTIWEMSAAQLLHKLSALGSWEEYLAGICRELRKKGDILYLSNFSELFEVGQYAGNSQSMADYLRDYLSREEIVVISECTPAQATRMDLRSPGYLALFTVVAITEKSPEQLQEIVRLRSLRMAEQAGSFIEDGAIVESLRLQRWFTPYSGLPGKTIRFLQGILTEKEQHDIRIVDEADVYQRFCQETGLPAFMIDPAIPLDYEEMKAFFQRNIYGQESAIETVLDLLVSVKAALIKRGKPLASLLFVGPTGVGKTEMAKVLAHFLFGNRDRMIRFDMSEYTDMQGILRLTGDLGAGEGLLTSVVRQNPFSVILFDELEKVHPAFYDLLLQILGEGRLTDARGRVADFCSTIIIMTSNIGAREYQTEGIGFTDYGDKKAEAVNHFVRAVQDHFRPELFNRLDRIIPFAPLEREVIRQIVDRELSLFLKREGLRSRPVTLKIDDEVRRYLAEKGYHPRYGARHLQRALQEQLTVPLSRKLNGFPFREKLNVDIHVKQEAIHLDISPDKTLLPADQKVLEAFDFTLVQLAHKLTAARRRAVRIRNGQCYLRLLSQFDQLERKLSALKAKNKEANFWKIPHNEQTYFGCRELIEKLDQTTEEILEMELTGLGMMAGLPADATALYEAYVDLSVKHYLVGEELLVSQYPELNDCTLGIFGNPQYLFSLADRYLLLAKKHEIESLATTVWFDPDNKRYLREDFQQRRHAGAQILCGVVIHFSGELAYLWFQGENGYHHWQGDDKTSRTYYLAAEKGTDDEFVIPEGVHRKNFFDGKKARRFYDSRGELRDTQYGIYLADGTIDDHLDEVLMNSYNEQEEIYLTR